MSYLLTEIALEMMGYKYYDIDGVLGQTNFKRVGPAAFSNVSTEGEPTLEQILGLAIDEEATTASAAAEDKNDAPTTSAPPVDTTAPSANAAVDSPPSASPSALVRILDFEFRRIREQIQRNQTLFVQAHTEQLKHVDQRGGCTPQEFLQPYVDSERRNLQREIQTMHAFRKLVERNLVKMNPDSYEKYIKTFRQHRERINRQQQVQARQNQHFSSAADEVDKE